MLHAPEPRNDREYLIQIYAAIQRMQEDLAAIPKQFAKHESRITTLERWQNRILPGIAFGGALIGGLAVALVERFLKL